MSILEGVKACNLRPDKPRFLIKPKPAKENREEVPCDSMTATDAEVLQLIHYIIAKSARLHELVQRRGIFNEEVFFEKHLLSSLCLKTLLKQVLDKLMADRRIGRNLKGMNKSNLQEIEQAVWTTLEREAALYHNHLDYTRQKQQLSEDLARRKQQIKDKLQHLSSGEREDVMLTQNTEPES